VEPVLRLGIQHNENAAAALSVVVLHRFVIRDVQEIMSFHSRDDRRFPAAIAALWSRWYLFSAKAAAS
jgi:hypothetical protein